MPSLNPALDDTLRRHWTLTRVIGLATCLGAPLAYLLVLVLAPLQGDPRLLFHGMPAQSFRDPLVVVFLFLGIQALAAPLLVRNLFASRVRAATTFEEALNLTRTATLVACALLESAAILGLVLGITKGAALGPLAFAMILATPAGYFVLVPDLDRWRVTLEEKTWE